jgi:molecular chaperone Hsp33
LNNRDYLVRAMLGENQARVIAVRTTGVVSEAQALHGTTPVATAALGRTLTMGLVLGAMLKAEETITIQIKADGPLEGIIVSANSKGQVKGYVGNPGVELDLNAAGKLAVGQAVGRGHLHVIRDMGLKEPYHGTVPLQSGEIGDDFAYYFTVSEQTPSAVLVGVLVGVDGVPLGSGGVVVQLMPGAAEDEAFIASLEERIQAVKEVSSLFAGSRSPEEIVQEIFAGLELRFIDRRDVAFSCDCSRERFSRGLVTLGAEELQEMVDGGEPVEIHCRFCSKRYVFTIEEVAELLKELGSTRA